MRSHHLVITGRVSIILIIIILINIIFINRRSLWKRRGKRCNMSLSTGNATKSGVHLTHLICEIVKTTTKVSLHLLKLRHDGLEGHTTSCEGRGSGRR